MNAAGAVNEPLLREVLAFIELHPQQWDQGAWIQTGVCGTTACLAGWTVVLADPVVGGLERMFEVDFTRMDIRGRAQALLGFTDEQVEWLFYYTMNYDEDGNPVGRPTFADFCERVERVTGVRFKPPETLDAA